MKGLVLALAAVFTLIAPEAPAETVDLALKSFKHIQFDDIPPTAYSNEGDELKAVVKKSSSILLKPFKEIRSVKEVDLAWKAEGDLKIKNAEMEGEKEGDDSFFRVGLIIHGDPPSLPSFFLPAWIKAIKETMILPTDRLLYLVVGAKHAAGKKWESPYSDSMQLVSVASKPGKDGWNQVVHKLGTTEKVVGLWLMADGDNTGSSFETRIKDLTLR